MTCLVLQHCSSYFFFQNAYCDVTLLCEGRSYPSHKLVLSACSEYFLQLLELAESEHPYIVITDINCKELEALLAYMYNGQVNVLQENIPALIKAAAYLKIKGLIFNDRQAGGNAHLSKQQKRSPAPNEEASAAKRWKESNEGDCFLLEKAYTTNDLNNPQKEQVCVKSSGELMEPANDPQVTSGEVSLLNTFLFRIYDVNYPGFNFCFSCAVCPSAQNSEGRGFGY